MGKQILFHMFPEDCKSLLEFARGRDRIVPVLRSTSVEEIQPVSNACEATEALSLWNRSLISHLTRKYIPDAENGPYFRVDSSLPVLELINSRRVDWNGTPALLQGRIWGAFERPSQAYLSWFDSIARWIRRSFAREESLKGYVSPSVNRWQIEGGILLPMFSPPDTPEWRKFIQEQRAGVGAKGTKRRGPSEER